MIDRSQHEYVAAVEEGGGMMSEIGDLTDEEYAKARAYMQLGAKEWERTRVAARTYMRQHGMDLDDSNRLILVDQP